MSRFPTIDELRIVAIRDRGVPDRERVAIRVERDASLGDYLLITGSWTPAGTIRPSKREFFNFPDEEVLAGSWVILYTGFGVRRHTTIDATGDPALVLHWQQPSVLLRDLDVTVAILEIMGIALIR